MLHRGLLLVLFVNVAFATPRILNPEVTSNPYIIAGLYAGPGQFPWQVSLKNSTEAHFCGGSIINAQYILTAAHCVINETPSNIGVYLGSHLLTSQIRHDVQQIRCHPNFNTDTLANDIAVLRVSPNIIFNDLTQAIPLVSRNVDNEVLEVSGWGRTYTSGPIPNNLQYIFTTATPLTTCQAQVAANADNVCSFTARGIGLCFGDDGSPLVKRGEGQVGVSSFANGCGDGNPNVYASVRYHRSWIINNSQ